VYCSTLKTTEF